MGNWNLAGNIKGPAGDPDGGIENGENPLIKDQNYVDIEFHVDRVDEHWGIRACSVVKLIADDSGLLNIGTGTITDKTVSGFRQWLLGAADADGVYVLQWSIVGMQVPVVEATTYLLTGPTTAKAGTPSDPFTVKLPRNTKATVPVTITPSDGSGGTFAPASVVLSTATPVAMFTYTAASGGAKTVTATNDQALLNPAGINVAVLATVLDASFNAVAAFTDNWYAGDVSVIAESFGSGGGVLDHARKILRKTGAPTGNVVAKVYAADSSAPYNPAAVLAVSDPVPISAIVVDNWNTFNFSGANRITLVNGTLYYIGFEFTGGDASNKLGYWYAPDTGAFTGWTATFHAGGWDLLAYSYDTDFELWVIR